MNRIINFFRDPEYYRALFRLALPIALQSLISSSLNFVSVVMIGQLGETGLRLDLAAMLAQAYTESGKTANAPPKKPNPS